MKLDKLDWTTWIIAFVICVTILIHFNLTGDIKQPISWVIALISWISACGLKFVIDKFLKVIKNGKRSEAE